MKINGQQLSLIQEEYLTNSEFAKEMAAANLTMEVAGLLEDAILASGITREELAEKIHGTPECVDELLEAEGNIQVSSLARLLNSMGFALKLQLVTERIDEYGTVHHEPVPEKAKITSRRKTSD